MSSPLDRLYESRAGSNGKAPEFHDEQLAEQCPDVHQWLSCEEWNGKPRQLPTITLFVDDGRLKCCLSDRETEQTAFWTFQTAFGVFRELQDAFAGENLDWKLKFSDRSKRNKRG